MKETLIKLLFGKTVLVLRVLNYFIVIMFGILLGGILGTIYPIPLFVK